MKKILEFAGDLRFAFRLILAAGAVMWIGSVYASVEYTLIYSMNGVPLVRWFAETGVKNISVTWWIPVMFLVFTLLGINTLACTINRVMILLPRRKIIGTKRFLVLISPSVIHILFILMLAGHFLSFTSVSHQKFAITEGGRVSISGIGDVEVKSIRYHYFPDSSLLRERVKQSEVEFTAGTPGAERSLRAAFLEPVFINGNIILLDMERKKQERIIKPEPSDDNCNKEQKFLFSQKTPEVKPQLYFLVVKDPGLYMLFPGFCVVICIMGWYFYQTNISGNNKEFMEDENEVINS